MMMWAMSSFAPIATSRLRAAKRTQGTYERSQKFPFGNGIGVYGRLVYLFERLRIDKGWGRTTCGNRQSSSSRRSGSQPANWTSSRICETRELLGERENHTDI
jgi:hypothetical protein